MWISRLAAALQSRRTRVPCRVKHRHSRLRPAYIISLLEDRILLASDFGDAPDTGAGTASGNYESLLANGGASHIIDATQMTLFLGNSVDADDGTLQNSTADADDRFTASGSDDEDGVLSSLDLLGTEGAAPTITLLVTNTTGSEATLSGWIDYNSDGLFDSATERTQVAVPDSSIDRRFTLTFPNVPDDTAGTTYARFRLSSDPAAENPTGAASDGEVEDYVFKITAQTSGVVGRFTKIADQLNGGPTLAEFDQFGQSVAALGDLDGDGINELAVGTDRDEIYVLFPNADGTVKNLTKITGVTIGGTALTSLGDLDGDGITDIAVGSKRNDSVGIAKGAVFVLFLNADGTVKASTKIADETNGGPQLNASWFFGVSVAGIGDLDGDGVTDLAVGARDPGAGDDSGAVFVLFLNTDGSVKGHKKIGHQLNGGPSLGSLVVFGSSVTSLGDLDGDGVTDLAVGAPDDGTEVVNPGAVHVLFLNPDGTAKASRRIGRNANGGPTLGNNDRFGTSVSNVGDLDGDGVTDLAVGAFLEGTGGFHHGAVFLLFMNPDGTVSRWMKIADQTNGGPMLYENSQLGSSVTSLGDLNGDGATDIAVGARFDRSDGIRTGSLYTMFLIPPVDTGDAPDGGAGNSTGDYATLLGNGGPSHTIRSTHSTLFLGNGVDREVEAQHNATADADDRFMSPAGDDEDGVLSPLDLLGTEGASPSITLLATNVTGSQATLSGWIDYNRNGVFEDTSERAQVTVPDGTVDGRFTLTFPEIPTGTAGSTYARFRLSSDTAAQSSTGLASGGEVEDYSFGISAATDGNVDKIRKIAHLFSDGPSLDDNDEFGASVESIGDLDGDGVNDLVVGAAWDDTGSANAGAVHVLFMNIDGTVKRFSEIASGRIGAPVLTRGGLFGSSGAAVGDLAGDGITELAVGARDNDTLGPGRGAVHILFLNADGEVKNFAMIASGLNGGPVLSDGDSFGVSAAALGDLDGDGVPDLAVGASEDGTGGAFRGAVYVLLLNTDGTVKASIKIASGLAGGPVLHDNSRFAVSLAAIGDLDNDGVTDLAAGASGDGTGGEDRGAAYVLLLNADGTVKESTKIAHDTNGGPVLNDSDLFGASVAHVGDLNGDGVPDLAVGAVGDVNDGDRSGAVWLLMMNPDGSVENSQRISGGQSGGPMLADGDRFGTSLSSPGDLDGDGVENGSDNCPFDSNSDQADGDSDNKGDICDVCPSTPNPDGVCNVVIDPTAATVVEVQTGVHPIGTVVAVNGLIVTGIYNRGVYAQDPSAATPANSGIHIFTGSAVAGVAVGDEINAVGAVVEFFEETELEDSTVTRVGAGTPITPISLTAAEAADEQYEGVLVSISDAAVSANPHDCTTDDDDCTDTDVWEINSLIVLFDRLYEDADWVAQMGQVPVTGVMTFRFMRRRLMPRTGADL